MKKIIYISIFSIFLFSPFGEIFASQKTMSVLIVPGHDNEFFGAEFRGLKESDINLELSLFLKSFLEEDPFLNPLITRDINGDYTKEFQDFFKEKKEEILFFQKENKEKMDEAVKNGLIKRKQKIDHNNAPANVSLRLNGINKWANDNNVDLIIHVHFNDYQRDQIKSGGEYNGFSMYVPESQFGNSAKSIFLAKSIEKYMQGFFPKSNLPLEKEGIIETQSLVAIGSNNSLRVPSVLVEYGYIYEPQLQNSDTRNLILRDLAWQTYLGIREYSYGSVSLIDDELNETTLIPFEFSKTLRRGGKTDKEIIALQAILVREGIIDIKSTEKERCYIDGIFGKCTELGLKKLQERYGIISERGFVGSRTRVFLNNYQNQNAGVLSSSL